MYPGEHDPGRAAVTPPRHPGCCGPGGRQEGCPPGPRGSRRPPRSGSPPTSSSPPPPGGSRARPGYSSHPARRGRETVHVAARCLRGRLGQPGVVRVAGVADGSRSSSAWGSGPEEVVSGPGPGRNASRGVRMDGHSRSAALIMSGRTASGRHAGPRPRRATGDCGCARTGCTARGTSQPWPRRRRWCPGRRP